MSKKFEHTLAFHCGPAILGIKASNLINLSLACLLYTSDAADEL